jgi:hypothetical protein
VRALRACATKPADVPTLACEQVVLPLLEFMRGSRSGKRAHLALWRGNGDKYFNYLPVRRPRF